VLALDHEQREDGASVVVSSATACSVVTGDMSNTLLLRRGLVQCGLSEHRNGAALGLEDRLGDVAEVLAVGV
jgi:hypothetical protein